MKNADDNLLKLPSADDNMVTKWQKHSQLSKTARMEYVVFCHMLSRFFPYVPSSQVVFH